MHTVHRIENAGADLRQPIDTAYHLAGSGEPLVLIHGYTGSKMDFHDQLDALAETHQVIAYDQRGHGDSSNAGPYDFNTAVADLFGLLDALGIERAHVLGHSMGGMVLARAMLTEQAQSRFASAILMDTSAEPLKVHDEKTRAQLAELINKDGCQALLPGMRDAPQGPGIAREIAQLGEAEFWHRIGTKLGQMDPAAFIGFSRQISDEPGVLKALKSVQIPTTVLVGRDDKPFIRPSKRLAKHLPQAELVTLDDAAHSPQYETPQAWLHAITAHLRQHTL